MILHWVTTNANPRHPGTGFDAGQRGWRQGPQVRSHNTGDLNE